MVDICAIASGSNGNCYYIGNSGSAVLIDAGVSCRQILKRMEERGLDPLHIKAVLISHEHVDHCCGAKILSKKLGIPVYMTGKTWNRIHEDRRPGQIETFVPGDTIIIERFKIHTFSKNHDAVEPCSFRVEYNSIHIGVFTDIGLACRNVSVHLGKCHALFMETNYDEEMLWSGSYPYYLKSRIASSNGHLSNIQAFQLIKECRHADLKIVLLSHLSAENNTPEMALSAFNELKDQILIQVTDRCAASDVYTVY